MSEDSSNGGRMRRPERGGTYPALALDARYRELNAARRAALNLMEDAVEAKRRADELVKELQSEIESRKRAEAALRKSKERQALLLKLSDELRAQTTPDAVIATASQMLGERLNASRVVYAEIDEAAGVAKIRQGWTAEGAEVHPAELQLSDFSGPLLDDLKAGRTVRYDDVGSAPYEREDLAALAAINIKAGVIVPLVVGGRFIVNLNVHQHQPRSWTDDEVQLIEAFAERTWAAVERARSEDALRESEAKYRTLFDSMDEGFCIIEVLFDPAGKPFDWKFCEVNPAFEKNNGLNDAVGRRMLEMVPDIEHKWFEIYGKIAEFGEPLRFVENSVALNRWFDLYAFRVGDPEEHKVAVLFTDITQKRLIEEELLRSNERMRLLIESATEFSIFTTDVNGIINSWNTGSQRIYGYTEDEIVGQEVAILFTEEDRKRGAHVRELEVASNDGRAHDERWHLRKDGTTFFASGLTQPIGEDGREGFVKIARDMTEQIMAQQARREKERLTILVEAQEAERRRIARDLHDELGQQLTALRLKLDRASVDAPPPLEGPIAEAQEIAKNIDEGVDFLAWELRPAALDDLGLVPALEKFVKEWSAYSGVTAELNATTAVSERRFQPEVETALYRIVQEALNNVNKHAHARNAHVALRTNRGNVVVTVDDDGDGFDPYDTVVRRKGIGLIGIRERVQMIGGSLDIESDAGKGTTLFVKAPIESKAVSAP